MAVMNVNPTRMELTRLKRSLKVAVRGHKLLKDKRDEMMRRFVGYVRENEELRRLVEKQLNAALNDFLMARAVMGSEVLEEAVLFPTKELSVKTSKQNVMSVNVPTYEIIDDSQDNASPFPYGFMSTSGELDESIKALNAVSIKMIELAEKEKTCNLLADEIEKTRRRVNALEYVMIPDMQDTISYINMKLDENERSNLTRLMKVKDMLENQQ